MRFSTLTSLAAGLLLPSLASAASITDEYQDADVAQSGYLPYHNIDPSKLSSYVMSWTMTFNANEQFLAKPITYTPNGYSHELVIVVSEQNIVRVLDGPTGTLLYSRTLDPPFSAADSNCGDVSPLVGITGTPIIDPATDVMYFFSKGYKNAAATGSGTINGQYKVYAVKIPNLTDMPGFPTILDGNYANNDPTRYFVGGVVLQRPGLAMIGNSIVAGFGGHCDNFNYTGLLVTVSKTSGAVTNMQAMVASPGAPSPQPTSIMQQTGGKAGIWQSGQGLAVSGNNVFFATGNGVGPGINKVQGTPASGKKYISTLEQVAANFYVDPVTGNLTQADYFEPYNFDTQLNGGDRDIGSSGVALLDRNTFKAPGVGVNGMAVIAGKNGVIYTLNADNLGGFYNGVPGPDASLQQIAISSASFFGGVGSYPLEGGYLYFCPSGGTNGGILYAYKFGLDANGNPVFTQAGTGGSGFACNSNPTVTSFNGQPGTGVVWLADVNNGLVAFKAVPVNGQLVPIPLGMTTGRLNKFQRPAFGNARIYTTENNVLYSIAAPGAPPPPPVISSSTSSTGSSSSALSSTSSSTSSSSTSSSSSVSTTSASSSTASSTSSSSSSSSISSTTSSSSSASSTSTSSSSSSSLTLTSSSMSSSSSVTTSSSMSSTSSSSSSSVASSTSSGSSVSSSSSQASSPAPSSSSSAISSSSTAFKTSSSSVSTSSGSASSSITSSSSSVSSSSTIKSSSTSTSSTARGSVTANPKPILRTYNWDIGWVRASPDGFARPVVGINGQWPCPPLVANVGDTIKINVNNTLGNQTTAIHFHGLFQTNTTFEDGPAMVTQCPIPPGQVFVYEFTLLQSGTYWYHAHVGGQYIDGLRGPLIIRDNNALANYGNIDKEVTLTLTDWYHVEAPYLINYFLSANNTSGAEPVPHTALINEAQNVPITMTPGKLYMFHIVNMGAVAGQYLQFDQHTMTIIEADGVYTQPMQVDQLFVGVAQRYTVLVQAKSSATQNFAIVSQFLTDMFESSNTPPGQQPTCTGWLVYNPSAPMPAPFTLTPQPWDDSQLVPWDQTPMYDSNNVQYIYLTADFGTNSWGGTRAMFNGVTYLPQKVPTFFSALSAPSQYLMNPQIYGQINPQILPYNAVIELNVNNHDSRAHPFHLHGHNFQLINRAGNEPMWPGTYSTAPAPMRRDTIIIYPGTGATIRFVANNPGIQLFHCHTEWHVETGLTATFIEAPDVMIARKPYIPNSHKTVCDVQKIPRTGNAGGNSKNWLDLSNSNTESSPTYYGALINPPATNPYQGGPA